MDIVDVKVKKVDGDAVIPGYESKYASGFDLTVVEGVELEPGDVEVLSTGLKVAIPVGYEIQIRPRSGWSIKTYLRISNAPGTIDSDYRGEMGIIVENIGEETIVIEKGMQPAQGVLQEVPKVRWNEVDELPDTKRGEGGFGHTGM